MQGRRQAVTATFKPKKLCALMLMMMWVQCHVRQRLLLHHQLIFKRSSRPPHAAVHAHLLRCFLLLSRSHASQIIPHLSSETFTPPPLSLSLSLSLSALLLLGATKMCDVASYRKPAASRECNAPQQQNSTGPRPSLPTTRRHV